MDFFEIDLVPSKHADLISDCGCGPYIFLFCWYSSAKSKWKICLDGFTVPIKQYLFPRARLKVAIYKVYCNAIEDANWTLGKEAWFAADGQLLVNGDSGVAVFRKGKRLHATAASYGLDEYTGICRGYGTTCVAVNDDTFHMPELASLSQLVSRLPGFA